MSNTTPINKGIPVVEPGTNFLHSIFLKWLQFVERKLNRAVVTDENGNISYNNAEIPSDLNDGFYWEVSPSFQYVAKSNTLGSAQYYLSNAYFNSNNQWYQPNSFGPSSLFLINSGVSTQSIEMRVAAAGQPSGIITWQNCLRFGTDGVLHLKTGSTIVYDL